ncbi:MAG: lactate utilization protein [bacterium]|nr:lactate utilization protein [bacterium]
MSEWTTLASEEQLQKTMDALKAKGFHVEVAENGEEAKRIVLEVIPAGEQVFDSTSDTLATTGIAKEIRESGRYKAAQEEIFALDHTTQGDEIRKIRSTPMWVVGSVHAITEKGQLMIASGTGSQLASYAYGAGHVVYVVGTQKLVTDIDAGMERIYEHSLPLESERARKAYGVAGSNVSKVLIVNNDSPNRATVILVKEVLGY